MTKRKRRRHPRTTDASAPSSTAPPARPGARVEERRTRKEEARRQRDAARRRARRTAILRRAATFAVIGAVALAVGLYLTRSPGSGDVGEEALRAAEEAGCGEIETPEDPADARGSLHLEPGEPYSYPREPATSGFHDPSTLPPEPRVHAAPIPETRAVHNLEHGYVIVYYRAEGEGALPDPVVDRLAGLVEGEEEVLMAPHAGLDRDVALAFTAWNRLWECPGAITPEQAEAMLRGWIRAFRNSGNAPEAFA